MHLCQSVAGDWNGIAKRITVLFGSFHKIPCTKFWKDWIKLNSLSLNSPKCSSLAEIKQGWRVTKWNIFIHPSSAHVCNFEVSHSDCNHGSSRGSAFHTSVVSSHLNVTCELWISQKLLRKERSAPWQLHYNSLTSHMVQKKHFSLDLDWKAWDKYQEWALNSPKVDRLLI